MFDEKGVRMMNSVDPDRAAWELTPQQRTQLRHLGERLLEAESEKYFTTGDAVINYALYIEIMRRQQVIEATQLEELQRESCYEALEILHSAIMFKRGEPEQIIDALETLHAAMYGRERQFCGPDHPPLSPKALAAKRRHERSCGGG